MINFNRKTLIIIIAIVALIGFLVWQGFLKKEKPEFASVKVNRGNISQEVSETGQVKKGEEIELSFKNSGKIERIYVNVGENVKEGQVLVKLDTVQLQIQLQEAKATLEVAQAKLNKLLAGSSLEEIQIAETEVKNSQISLNIAKENLEQAYQDALNVLDDSYLKIDNSLNVVRLLQRTYFIFYDKDGLKIKENKEKIEAEMLRVKPYLEISKENYQKEKVDTALLEMKNSLETVSKTLTTIREVCEDSIRSVSSTDRTTIDTQRANINTAIANITNSQQSIASMKLNVNLTEGQLQETEDQLALVKAKPRQEDIDLYQAQIEQVQAQIRILEAQIEDANLISPTGGQVKKIKKRVGEIVQPVLADSVVTLLPEISFQTEVNVYEADVVKIRVGNPVDIVLVAFPGQVFKGRVVSIEPAEKIIEEVVYYKTTINFEEIPEGIKPGMTADITIKTALKENVLVLPKEAIQKKDGRTIVEVLKDNVIEEREIETGILGNDNSIEVVSGLVEGEEVIIR